MENENEDVNENRSKDIIGYPFSEFWNDYDKKVGSKDKLEIKFNKLSPQIRQLIKDYIPKYKQSQPEKRYRKNPETFLNQKGWEHELIYSGEQENPNLIILKD